VDLTTPKPLAPMYWGVIVTTVLAAAITLATFLLADRLENQDQWVRHTFAVRNELQVAQAELLRAESSQRGYLLTGRNEYLLLYNPAVAGLRQSIDRGAGLVGDNPSQVEAFRVLRSLVDDKLAEMGRTIEQRSAGHADAALAIVETDVGRRAMDAISNQLQAMQGTEERLLTQREIAARSLAFYFRLGSIIVFLLIGGVGILVVYFANRSISAINAANAQLSAANSDLLLQINQREAVEAQLRQSQKMDAIGQLSGGVAHDFNNMLGVIIGALDLMRRRMKTDEFDVRRFVDTAIRAAERSAALTQRLLAFARQQPLAPEPIDANRMISDMSDLLRSTLGEHIQIETVLAAGLWKASADAHQLEGAIVNIAINARDAMRDGGKLTVETGNVYLDEAYCRDNGDVTAGQYVMIAITDKGVGMSPEIAARAFDPFFTTKPSGKGTGLGLSQVYGFVKQSLGHIKVYSELGTGTTVKIYLPRLRGPVEEARRAAPQAVKGDADEVILVVEDDPLMLRLSADALRELGYSVIESESAVHAMLVLDENPGVKLLFTDVVMPEVNGRKLADEALLKRPNLKVLFTTGYTRNAVVHGGVLDPDVNFLSKPFTLEQLASKVRSVLDD